MLEFDVKFLENKIDALEDYLDENLEVLLYEYEIYKHLQN